MNKKAFTLLEIMITVIIVGILIFLAIHSAKKIIRHKRDARFIADLKMLHSSAAAYILASGTVPPDTAPGEEPPALAPYLPSSFNWNAPTPIGGHWNWDAHINGVEAAVGVTAPNRSKAEMQAIEQTIDASTPDKDSFKETPGGYMWIIEE
ncbi:MAG TPA: type II secretion system protein [Opitutales bacterium]|nr:type II secretion system protein [Opitutales bacterium]